MKKILIQLCMMLCLMLSTSSAMALSDEFYVTGEDLDYLAEERHTHAIEEIEEELRKFVLYRKLEDLIINLNEGYVGMTY